MNYLEIVMNGFIDPTSRDFLANYFYREFKKAEEEHFERDEFFNGCLKVVEALESEMDKRLYSRKNELYLLKDLVKAGNFTPQTDTTKTLKQQQKEIAENLQAELLSINRNNFPVNLLHFTNNKFIGHFYYNSALEIRQAISEAKERTIEKNEILTATPRIKDETKYYSTFHEMFEAATKNNLLGESLNYNAHLAKQNLYDFNFSSWLQKNKGLENGNEVEYLKSLNDKTFNEYLKFETLEKQKQGFLETIKYNEGTKIFQDRFNLLKNKFTVKRITTKEDCQVNPNYKEGIINEFEPEYKTTEEAFGLLKNYYSVICFEWEMHLFREKYRVVNIETIKAEIEELELFIRKAEKANLSKACSLFGKWGGNEWEYVYRRFKADFYENIEVELYPIINDPGSDESKVYGKYFLFYDHLKKTLSDLTAEDELLKGESANNSVLQKAREISQIFEYQNKKELPKIEEVKKHLKSLVSKDEKMKYLKLQKENYLLNLSFEDFAVSGMTSVHFPPNTELFFDKFISDEIRRIETEEQDNSGNDYLLSTIEDWIYPFKQESLIDEINYSILVSALKQYFETKRFPPIKNQIKINKVNKKRLGWALNQIFRAIKANNENLPKDYLMFAKQNISLFANVEFDETDVLNSNLYKYFTTKTQ